MLEPHQPNSSHEAPSSKAPTLTPSTASMTDMEKDRPSTTSPSSSDSDSATPAPMATEAEKTGDLHRQLTAKSQQHGDELQNARTREDGTEYPTGLKLSLITLALCLAVFLMALDNAIIATAIPKISDQFQSLSDVGWYGSAYLLTTAALQLLFGKFYTFWSIKWVFLTAIGIFELGSLICGVAQNSETLIVGRAVAGIGAAGMMSGALLILAHSVPLEKRPVYSGLIGGMYGIASVAGPLLGGVFTDRVTWRWCFLINLPIGAVTIFVIIFFFPASKVPKPADETFMERFMRFDPIGTVVFMPAIICLLLALQWGGTEYPWNSGRIIALFVVFGVLIITFIYIQWRQQENATVPPRIIGQRSVLASSIFVFGLGSSFFIMVYYIPIWFQAVLGASAIESGIRNLPLLISVVVFTMVSGGIVTTIGYYAPFMILSSILIPIGIGLISTWKPDSSSSAWIGFQILTGAGVGFGMQQPLMAVQTVLGIKDIPTGTAVVVFLQTIGGALFISVGQSVFTNKLIQTLAIDVPDLDPAIVLATGATNLQKTLPAEYLPGVIDAYNTALTTAFLVAVALAAFSTLGSVIIEWKSVKGKKIEAGLA